MAPLVVIDEQPKMRDAHTLQVNVTGTFSSDPNTSKSLSIEIKNLNGMTLNSGNCPDCKWNIPTGPGVDAMNSFRINLENVGVKYFEDNQSFTVTATATENNTDSDPDSRAVEIPLPVVHVHGILSDVVGDYVPHQLFAQTLEVDHPSYEEDKLDAGYPTLFSFPYSSLQQSNRITGDSLAAWIRTHVLPATHAAKVNIVAHSMGGIIIRSAIWYSGARELCNKVILVGSPSEGATLAAVAVSDWLIIKTIIDAITLNLLPTSPLYTIPLQPFASTLIQLTVAHNLTAKELLPVFGWWGNTKQNALQGFLLVPPGSINPFLPALDAFGLPSEVRFYAITASGMNTLTKLWGRNYFTTAISSIFTDKDAFGPGDGIVPISSQLGANLGWRFQNTYDVGSVFHTGYFENADANLHIEDFLWE